MPRIPTPGSLTSEAFLSAYQRASNREMNEEQRLAVQHGEGPLFVMAGPGSGKSEVMVSRALKLVLVDGAAPQSLFLTTFTEKAARNLQDRLTTRLLAMGYDTAMDDLRVGTLHSLCDRTMRDFRYMSYAETRLLNETEQSFFIYAELIDWFKEKDAALFWEFFRFLNPSASREYGANQWQKVSALVVLFNRLTDEDVDLTKLAASDLVELRLLAEAVDVYRKRLSEKHRADFSTLQLHFREFLESSTGKVFLSGSTSKQIAPLRYVLVDEYQDTNPIQEDIYFRLARACQGNITIVGDDDQALYRFRGGTVECLVRFPTRCYEAFGKQATQIQLRINYRSLPEITAWAEKVIAAQPEMRSKGARSPKQPMVNARESVGGYQPVSIIVAAKAADVAKKVAAAVKAILDAELVQDPAQIAILMRSTKESPRNAGPLCSALRDAGIGFYNPRSKAFLESEEISLMLGTLIELVDEGNVIGSTVGGFVKNSIVRWRGTYHHFSHTHPDLRDYVKMVHAELLRLEPGDYLAVTLRDLFYRVLSRPPFSAWQEDPSRTFRLGQLSAILESFSSVDSDTLRVSRDGNGRFSQSWLRARFYPRLIGYLHQASLDDPEDMDHQIVPGLVQVMTVHQSKGLEFPVVVVGSLALEPKAMDVTFRLEDLLAPFSRAPRSLAGAAQRAVQDLVRFYYVAFTRAENALLLSGHDSEVKKARISLARN